MAMLLPSDCNSLVTIVRPSPQGPGFSGKPVYTEVGTAWCRIVSETPYKRFLYAQNGDEVTHRIYFPFGTDIRNRDKIIFGKRSFEQANVVNPDEANEYIKVETKELSV